MSATSNPLLERGFPIPFDSIAPEHVEPAVTAALAEARGGVEALADGAGGTYDEVLGELDRICERVARVWAPVSHLVNVASSPELRRAYAEALPRMTRFSTRLLQDAGLHRRIRDLADSLDEATLSALEKRHVEKTLREFRRAGAELDPSAKAALERMRVELSDLGRRFQDNLLEETAAYAKIVDGPEALAGLPEATLERARRMAAERGEEGWAITLDMPTVEAVLKHAADRELRREIHSAYLDRCTGGERDNRPLIARILELRRREAELLGYDDFPHYRLEEAMAASPGAVRAFLDRVVRLTRPHWERDAGELEACARRSGLATLEPWDVSHLMERLRRERFDVDDEALRPWFPLEEVQRGLFEIAERLFGLSVAPAQDVPTWHADVRFFEVRDATGLHLGSFYTDWFPRETKRQGAWMDGLVTGGARPDGGIDPHLAFIGGNFSPPTAARPALLTHREVRTLFHEFGHLLHHTASRVEIAARGGVNVAWDWVEVPSQIMENWTWEREALDRFARRHDTGEALPDALLERLLAARRFMGGWHQMRQLSFAHLDLELHRRAFEDEASVMEFAAATLRPFVPSDRFVERHILPSFAHLFGGGYASAYYSYLWSETLEADAFTRFRREGVLNPETGRDFLAKVLSQGDRRDPADLFRAFQGRDPDHEALIRRNLGPLNGASEAGPSPGR